MLPTYESRRNSQHLGFEGPNLKEKRHTELLTRTPEIKAEAIHTLGDNCFYVKSMSKLSHMYQVDLGKQCCDCLDWPWVWLCKHITAIAHFFGDLQLLKTEHTVPRETQPIREGSPNAHSVGSDSTTLENLITVSRAFLQLQDHAPLSPDTS